MQTLQSNRDSRQSRRKNDPPGVVFCLRPCRLDVAERYRLGLGERTKALASQSSTSEQKRLTILATKSWALQKGSRIASGALYRNALAPMTSAAVPP
jgi:hypothetical protein